MNIVPKLVATTGAAAVTAGLVAFTPTAEQHNAPAKLPFAAAPATPVSREVQLTAGIGDIFTWAYWVEAAPWAFLPVSALTTPPAPPTEFVFPTIGNPGVTLQSVYTSYQPWVEFLVKESAYAAGWVPLGIGFIQPELFPIVVYLIAYSVVAPPAYDFVEAIWTPAVNVIAGILGAPPAETPEDATAVDGLGLAAAQATQTSAASQTEARQAVAPAEEQQPASAQELADANPAPVDAVSTAVAQTVEHITDVATAAETTQVEPAAADTEEAPASGEDAAAATRPAVDEVAAGGARVTESVVAAPGTVATATVNAQGDVRDGVAEAGADALGSGDHGAVRRSVTEAPSAVAGGLKDGARDLAQGVSTAGDDVRSAVTGGGADSAP